MRQKLIFMCINMNIGGTEKALLNMINEIPKDKYEVTILMLEEYGGFLPYIPDWVTIKYLEGFKDIKELLNNPPLQLVKKFIKEGNLLKGINIFKAYLISKILGERSYYFKTVLKNYEDIKEEYDIAVAYAGPMEFITYFILNKVKAKRRVQWIHFDITKIGFNYKFAEKLYSKFDKIYVVSKLGREKLISKMPSLKDKTEVFYNIVSEKAIENLSYNGTSFEDGFDGVRILTVGRLSKEKGQDLTIKALAKLKEEGYKVRWYSIGEGSARDEYESIIKEYKLQDDYILLGAKANPYPYMRDCDLYVQPSRHEGYCITLAEAKVFNKYIVATNFTGAKEQITNDEIGAVVDFNLESIVMALKEKI